MPAISNPTCRKCGSNKRADEFLDCARCRSSRWHTTEEESLDKVPRPADQLVPVSSDHKHSWVLEAQQERWTRGECSCGCVRFFDSVGNQNDDGTFRTDFNYTDDRDRRGEGFVDLRPGRQELVTSD